MWINMELKNKEKRKNYQKEVIKSPLATILEHYKLLDATASYRDFQIPQKVSQNLEQSD